MQSQKFSAQFKFKLNEYRPDTGSGAYEHIEGLKMEMLQPRFSKFYAKSYYITFLLEPNRDGYATFTNIEDKL